MFYGEFDYKVDEKGRIPIPPRFRNFLKDGVVLTPGADKCITAYTLPEWKKLAATLTSSSGRAGLPYLHRCESTPRSWMR